MAVYRVLERLSKGERFLEVGELVRLEWLKPEQIARLEVRGAVSRISAPPLAKLPGWKLRSQRLAKAGITGVEELLEADTANLAEQVQADPRTVELWKRELTTWLSPPGLKRLEG